MKHIKKRDQTYWEKIKPYGIKSYLIKEGIFRNGLFFFILIGFITPLIVNGFSKTYFQSEVFKNKLIFAAVYSLLSGMLISYLSWKNLEKKY